MFDLFRINRYDFLEIKLFLYIFYTYMIHMQMCISIFKIFKYTRLTFSLTSLVDKIQWSQEVKLRISIRILNNSKINAFVYSRLIVNAIIQWSISNYIKLYTVIDNHSLYKLEFNGLPKLYGKTWKFIKTFTYLNISFKKENHFILVRTDSNYFKLLVYNLKFV